MTYETWRREMSAWARARGCNLALFDSVDSTNEVGSRLLAGHREPGSMPVGWLFALHQRAGKGRMGRRWASPHGAGVYASRLVELPRSAVSVLPQLVGVALCEALRTLNFECRLKWPNDLLLNGKKVGGILLLARGSGERVRAVAGFGVNYSHGDEELPREDSTSLRLAGVAESLSLARLSRVLAERVDDELAAPLHGRGWNPEHIAERYRTWSAHELGDRMVVSLGDDVCAGEFAGFAANGELRLRHESGESLLSAGEVES